MPRHEPADPLHDLRDRLRETHEAAQRLAGQAEDATAAGETEAGIPPAGWGTGDERATLRDELEEVAALLRALRELVPPDLQAQLTEVLRQVLLLLRAVLDWWVQRLEPPAPGDGAAPDGAARDDDGSGQDIPIA
jgi:hypothetical protein